MDKVSVIIPAREEEYLQRTIDDLFAKAKGDVEVIAVLDGYWPNPPLKEHDDLHIIHKSEPGGMRSAINAGSKLAKGKFLLKCDAHCIFDEGYDVKLKADLEPNWVMVPRRYGLTRKKWEPDKRLYEFQYISHPKDPHYPFKGCNWPEFAERVNGQKLVDLMTTQGSCWFTHKDYFLDHLEGLDEINYGWMGREAQELCLKTWLSGGRFVLNRNTWYAHMKRSTRPYKKKSEWFKKSMEYAMDFWLNDMWPKQTRNFDSLIEQFKPIPGWHGKDGYLTDRFIQEKYGLGHAQKYPAKVKKGFNRRGLCKLWAKLGYTVGCEVGVREGDFSQMMLDVIPDLKLYGVDAYIDYKSDKKRGARHDHNKRHALKRFEGRDFTLINKFSVEAAEDIKDGSLDFVYIDANHAYDFVMEDLTVWTPKVRIGGIISGHDYYESSRDKAKKAVDDWVEMNNIVPWYRTDNRPYAREVKGDKHISWFWVKK